LNSASIGSRSSIPGTTAARRRFRTGKSRRRSRPNGCAPARERDPGEGFPWERLWRGPRRPLDRARAGHWTEPAPLSSGPLFAHEEEGPPVRALQALLALYGWRGDHRRPRPPHETVVAAFQRHFRSERVDDEADASTGATLKALIEGLEYEQTQVRGCPIIGR
jgi:hypothetical protein